MIVRRSATRSSYRVAPDLVYQVACLVLLLVAQLVMLLAALLVCLLLVAHLVRLELGLLY